MEWLLKTLDTVGIMGLLFILLSAAAIIRIVVKAARGERIDVPPVGMMNDFPSSVTGINKHNDMSERIQERFTNKTE